MHLYNFKVLFTSTSTVSGTVIDIKEWFSSRRDFVSQEYLAMFEDIFGCHSLGRGVVTPTSKGK